MTLRTSPRTSGVHHACVTVHRACPSPPLYPPVRDTHARGLYGPCACHTKRAQAECAAASPSRRAALCKRTSGLPRAFLAHPKKDAFIRHFRLLRLSRRVPAGIKPGETGTHTWCARLPDVYLNEMVNLWSGRRSCGKGVRVERSIVNTLKADGIEAVRAPLSSADGARLTARSRLLSFACRWRMKLPSGGPYEPTAPNLRGMQ
jgi:hypothetical protein